MKQAVVFVVLFGPPIALVIWLGLIVRRGRKLRERNRRAADWRNYT